MKHTVITDQFNPMHCFFLKFTFYLILSKKINGFLNFDPGGVVLRVACVYYTLYSGINGWIWTCLWGSWCSLLEFTGKGDFFLGDLTSNGSSCVFSCLQMHPKGMFFSLGTLTRTNPHHVLSYMVNFSLAYDDLQDVSPHGLLNKLIECSLLWF